MTTKKTLRAELLARRDAWPAADFKVANAALVAALQAFIDAGGFTQVFSFTPHKGEPDLAALRAPVVGLPVVAGEKGRMAFRAWTPGDTLVANRFGIAEPTEGADLAADARTVILVPSVALDARGYRLGYGGGFYDRYIAANAADAAVLVGVAFAAFRVPALPHESHDARVGYVASECGVAAVTS